MTQHPNKTETLDLIDCEQLTGLVLTTSAA